LHLHIGHHFFGAGNIGDDFMLAGFLASVGTAGRPLTVSCCTPFRIDTQARRFPRISWRPNRLADQIEAVRSCDVWLGLGDSPFQSDSGSWFLDHLVAQVDLCRTFCKPMAYLGVGVNNEDVLALPQSRKIVDQAEHIWTRDDLSAECLSTIARPGAIESGADLSHLFLSEATALAPPTEASLGLILNFERGARFKDIFWLVQEVRTLKGSEHHFFTRLPTAAAGRIKLCAPRYDAARTTDLLAAWPRTEYVASSRYHGLLAAAWRGAKLVAVARSTKIVGAARDLGLDTHGPMRRLAELLDRAAPVPRERLSDLRSRAAAMVEAFLGAIDGIARVGRPTTGRSGAMAAAAPSPRVAASAALADPAPRFPAKDIAVLRLDRLGDMVLSSGFFRELRGLYPAARITAFAHGTSASYLRTCPHVNHVVTMRESVVDVIRLGRRDEFADAFGKQFHGTFDLVVNPRHAWDNSGAALLAKWIDAPIRIAFADTYPDNLGELADCYTLLVEQSPLPRPHPELNVALLRALSDLDHDPGIESWPNSLFLAKWWRQLHGPAMAGSRYYLLGVGASHAGKSWPAPHFAAVASALHDRHGLVPILTGLARDKPCADEVVARLRGPFLDVVDKTSVRDLVAISHLCRLYVGNDSGTKHVAAAAKLPVVEIGWIPEGCPALQEHDPCYFRPYGVEYRVVRPRGNFDTERILSGDAIRAIEPAAIIAAADELLMEREPAVVARWPA